LTRPSTVARTQPEQTGRSRTFGTNRSSIKLKASRYKAAKPRQKNPAANTASAEASAKHATIRRVVPENKVRLRML